MKIYHYLTFLVLVALSTSLQAAIVEGLYESEILVNGQGKSERNSAMKVAMREVLAKVSGQSNISSYPEMENIINSPSMYVQQYRYRKLNNSELVQKQNNPALRGNQVVWFRFDEREINKLLRQNNLPVWGKTRPSTLVWLAIEQDGGRYMLGSDTLDDLRHSLETEAQRRGLAVLIPLMDLEDQMALPFADVWGDFQESIINASARYQAEAILVGRMSLSPSDIWNGRWSLYENGTSLNWNYQGTMVDHVLSAGVAGAMEILAKRYAMVDVGAAPAEIVLSVVNVMTLNDYVRVSRYLASLEQIKGIKTSYVDADRVGFSLALRGNPQGLQQTIGLGNVLVAEQKLNQQQPTLSPFGGAYSNQSQTQQTSPGSEDEFSSRFGDNAYFFRLVQ